SRRGSGAVNVTPAMTRRVGARANPHRHARLYAGHPRLQVAQLSKTWMAGSSPAMTRRGGACKPHRHARPYAANPRLQVAQLSKTWMAGSSPAMTNAAMTNERHRLPAVMPGFMPGIHVFKWRNSVRRGWPGQARP